LSPRAAPTIHRAFQAVRGVASVNPVAAVQCIRRLYNRLNQDYGPLHALCRFFLEHLGPTHERGDHRTLPFLLDMARLFELFVAEWLVLHLPSGFRLIRQENVSIDEQDDLRFRIDLVLYREGRDAPLCVIDTKYKKPDRPSTADVQEVVTYAEAKGCSDAALVYPVAIPRAASLTVGRKSIRCLTFALDRHLSESGHAFTTQLLEAFS
jgi:5-methylcytosine-specific restriction enzyme subunit McrC